MRRYYPLNYISPSLKEHLTPEHYDTSLGVVNDVLHLVEVK